MSSKYVSKGANGRVELIAHCPYCRGVIFRDYKKDTARDEISFRTRCPHCKKTAGIFLKINDGVVIQKENGLLIKRVKEK